MKKICNKYGLIFGPVGRYEGEVPEENLTQIENFKIKDEDACWEEISPGLRSDMRRVISFQEVELERKAERERRRNIDIGAAGFSSRPVIGSLDTASYYRDYISGFDLRMNVSTFRDRQEKCGLEIVAPVEDFDTKGMALTDFELKPIEIPDPVVLQPVYHNGAKHYLIVTAWGEEASDPLVRNEKMN